MNGGCAATYENYFLKTGVMIGPIARDETISSLSFIAYQPIIYLVESYCPTAALSNQMSRKGTDQNTIERSFFIQCMSYHEFLMNDGCADFISIFWFLCFKIIASIKEES